MRKRYRIYHFVYGVMLLVFISVISWQAVHYKGNDLVEEKYAKVTELSEGWKNAEGEEIPLKGMQKLEEVTPYQQFSVYHALPDDLPADASLCFRSKNIFYEVYIDGKQIYVPYVPENVFYNRSMGTRWNYVELLPEYAGKDIEIKVTTVYENSRSNIDNIYIGSSLGAVLGTWKEKLVAFITCVVMLFVGLLLVIADIPINMQKEKNHELLYLGLFAMSIAVWCTAETNLLQFFIGDSRMLQFISCVSLMLIPIPMTLYLNAAFEFRRKWIEPVFVICSFGEFLICMILHLTGIADFHDTLKLTHCMLAVSAAILFYTIIRSSFVHGKNQTKNIYRMLRGIGLSSISVATVIDIMRYYKGNGNDSAMFVRIGLLVFVLCYGSSSLEKTINAVKLGVQTEFVSQLAYRDGLTGIGNRTAFQEHLVDLEKVKDEIPAVGILMFDVNDLKYVNDNLGHHLGDRMLVQSAEIIKIAFSGCDCFRIGGDEFSVLAAGDNVEKQCEQGIEQFKNLMQEFNDGTKPFRISIAYGYAIYNEESAGNKLMDIYQKADMLMYENKKEVKAKQSRPEEYYRENMNRSGEASGGKA